MASATERAIAQVRAAHLHAVNTTDIDLLLKGMTDDVVYIAPAQPPVRGKDAMRAFVGPQYERASIDITMAVESLEVAGSHATEWGYAKGTIAWDEGAPTEVNLAYLWVYRSDGDHGWRISHDISTPGS